MRTGYITVAALFCLLMLTSGKVYGCVDPPVVDLTSNLQAGATNTSIEVTYDASLSYDAGSSHGLNGIVKFEWDFNYYSGGGPTPEEAFVPDYTETATDHGDGKFDGKTRRSYGPWIGVRDRIMVRVTDYDGNTTTLPQQLIIYVKSTIQEAINVADASDPRPVVIAPGVYIGTGNTDISFGTAITLQSMDPYDPAVVAATVIDCEGLTRAFSFAGIEGSGRVLAGITISPDISQILAENTCAMG